jgi:hypothetical protein
MNGIVKIAMETLYKIMAWTVLNELAKQRMLFWNSRKGYSASLKMNDFTDREILTIKKNGIIIEREYFDTRKDVRTFNDYSDSFYKGIPVKAYFEKWDGAENEIKNYINIILSGTNRGKIQFLAYMVYSIDDYREIKID